MPISSNSIFHHTDKIEKLFKIIKSGGFINQYCSETIYLNQTEKIGIDVIMVSFCDIPLVDYKRYYRKEKDKYNEFELGYYGDFGIGLSKKWAVKNKLNPVFYVQKNSIMADSFKPLLNDLKSIKSGEKFDSNDILRFCKNYEGKLSKDVAMDKTYRYYNEREWRYIPNNHTINIDGGVFLPRVVKGFEFNNEGKKPEKDSANALLQKSPMLSFSCDDITFIIVKTEKQVIKVAQHLKKKLTVEMKRDSATQKNIDEQFYLLTSKIITTKQLIEDF